jgi:pimeloyl-ACP methyl ester carboxylesterase
MDAHYQTIGFTMPEPQLHYVACPDAGAGHRMAYWQWGNPQATHTVVCVHGLSRQGRDFDVVAQAIVERAVGNVRVICPDVVGRGHSDWLADPAGYQLGNYAADMVAMLTQLAPRPTVLDWVGTSMGGLLGLLLCGQPESPLPVPVRQLVLNDVGPTIESAALARIGQFLGKRMQFDTLPAAADALWSHSSGFGPHTPAQWLALSRHMVKPLGTGSGAGIRAGVVDSGPVVLHYDPAIAQAFGASSPELVAQGEAALWQLYDHITAQTLVLRGAQSDLLSGQTAQAMAQRGPKARLVEFAGVGHAPTLIAADQVQAVLSFLFDSASPQ